MKDKAILWSIVLISLVVIGIAGLIAFEFIEEIIQDYFFL